MAQDIDLNVILQQRIQNNVAPDVVGAEAVARVIHKSKPTVFRLNRVNDIPVFLWGGRLCSWRDILYKWNLQRRPGRAAKVA